MDDAELDRLLGDLPVDVPDGFSGRVVARIAAQANAAPMGPPVVRPSLHRTLAAWLVRAALTAGGLAGFAQLAMHLLASWLATAAG